MKQLLSDNDIKSELSLAYLHAVTARAGMVHQSTIRQEDNTGVDAHITYFGEIPGTSYTKAKIEVQLKCTSKKPTINNGFISYPLKENAGGNELARLMHNSSGDLKILVVLFLPEDPAEWLSITPDALIMKKAAYWVCLFGNHDTPNKTSNTIYIPMQNLLTPDSLRQLAQDSKHNIFPAYTKPAK